MEEKSYDAIVVGSGVGGASVARELSRLNKRVLIVEHGVSSLKKDSVLSTVSSIKSFSVSDGLMSSYARLIGGTTGIYFAVADMPPLDVFRKLGIDLSEEVNNVISELPLVELPDNFISSRALKIRDVAKSMGLDWGKRKMLIDLAECEKGDFSKAKWSAASYVSEAVENGATLWSGVQATRIITSNSCAVGIDYLCSDRGKQKAGKVYGSKIILSAGACASPRILQASEITCINNSGFYCHPSFIVCGLVKGLKEQKYFAGSLGVRVNDAIELGDANFAKTFHRILMLGNRKFLRAFMRNRCIGIGVMARDEVGGGMDKDGQYYKALGFREKDNMNQGEALARDILTNAGARNIFRSATGSAHFGGVIKVGEHIDSQLQTACRHLYVCDASVIPGDEMMSPTVTLVCLGKYAARQIAKDL